MERLLIPGALLVMFMASNEILSLLILCGLSVYVLFKIMSNRGY